ncbi:MAG: tetratricopeptide repeat protein, partial [Myxococcaceae bacterium]
VLVLGPLFVVALELSASPTPLRQRAARLLPAAAGLGLALALRLSFAPAWRATLAPLTLAQAVGTRLASLARSALTLALPLDRSLCDAFPITLPFEPPALAGLLVAAGLAWLAWRRRGPALLLALSVLPSLNLVAAPRFWSPHYLYLPLGFAAMLAAERLDRRGGRSILAGAAACVLLGAVCLADSSRYRDDTTLFSSEVAGRPECREAALYLGDAKRTRGDLEGAARSYEAAAAPSPGFVSYSDEPAALQNLGLVRLAQGRHFDAELAFEQALEQQPDPRSRRELTHDLAAVAVARGDPAGAVRLLAAEAARADPLPESILLLARALHEMGRDEDARAVLSRLPTSRP